MNKNKKVILEDDIKLAKDYGMKPEEIDKIRNKFFIKYEKHNSVSPTDIKSCLQDQYGSLEDQVRNEIEKQIKVLVNNNRIEFPAFVQLFAETKRLIEKLEQESQNAEYVDAFVALGGNHDTSGSVNKQAIIKELSEEFQLTINIDEFVRGLDADNDSTLSFDEFVKLFQNHLDTKNQRRSIASILTRNSVRPVENVLGANTKTDSLSLHKPGYVEIRDKDFDKLLLNEYTDYPSVQKGFSVKDRDFEEWYQKNQ